MTQTDLFIKYLEFHKYKIYEEYCMSNDFNVIELRDNSEDTFIVKIGFKLSTELVSYVKIKRANNNFDLSYTGDEFQKACNQSIIREIKLNNITNGI